MDPYVNHGKINATLPKDADPTTFTLEEADCAAGREGKRRRGRREFRPGPASWATIPTAGPSRCAKAAFGPYVNHGKTNATLKRDMSAETLSLEEAIRLVEDKAGAGTPKRKALLALPSEGAALQLFSRVGRAHRELRHGQPGARGRGTDDQRLRSRAVAALRRSAVGTARG